MGLRAFRESDAARFFGQERLIAQLAARVSSSATFTAVVGPSGAGKSSVVQAGLLPQVRRDVAEHAHRDAPAWFTALCRARGGPREPGGGRPSVSASRPSAATARGSGTRRPVCSTPTGTASCWWSTSSRSCSPSRKPTRPRRSSPRCRRPPTTQGAASMCSLTMRADFYDRPLADPALRPALRRQRRHRHPDGSRTISSWPPPSRPTSSTCGSNRA